MLPVNILILLVLFYCIMILQHAKRSVFFSSFFFSSQINLSVNYHSFFFSLSLVEMKKRSLNREKQFLPRTREEDIVEIWDSHSLTRKATKGREGWRKIVHDIYDSTRNIDNN